MQSTLRNTNQDAFNNQLQNSNRDSGVGAVGLGFLTAESDDEDDVEDVTLAPQDKHAALLSAATAAAARPSSPGLSAPPAAPPAAVSRTPPPNPALPTIISSHGPRKDLHVVIPGTAQPTPRMPQPAFMSPPPPYPNAPPRNMSPHPLQPPKTPITPVFARPLASEKGVTFDSAPILRGNSEETLLPRTTPKGEEFWRRFSMVVKDDHHKRSKRSTWLMKHETRNSRLSRWIWVLSIFLLMSIAGGIAIGWYFTHNSSPSVPEALGGNEHDGANATTTSTTMSLTSSSSSPLRTVTGDLPPSTTPPIPILTAVAPSTTAVDKI